MIVGTALEVDRVDLVRALKSFARFNRITTKHEAVLRFDNEELVISLNGVEEGMAAKGTWKILVRVPGGQIIRLAKALPPVDPVAIVVHEGRCFFGTVSVACAVGNASGEVVDLPMDPSRASLLALRQVHTPQEIQRSGLTRAVAEAQEFASRRMMEAFKLLEPLGVTPGDMRWMVTRAVRRHRPKKEKPAGQVALFAGTPDPEDEGE